MLRLCYEHDVRSSDRLPVMLVDCDHTVQEKVEISTRQDRLVSWLPACQSLSGSQYSVISNSTDED